MGEGVLSVPLWPRPALDLALDGLADEVGSRFRGLKQRIDARLRADREAGGPRLELVFRSGHAVSEISLIDADR